MLAMAYLVAGQDGHDAQDPTTADTCEDGQAHEVLRLHTVIDCRHGWLTIHHLYCVGSESEGPSLPSLPPLPPPSPSHYWCSVQTVVEELMAGKYIYQLSVERHQVQQYKSVAGCRP